ncbi:unnamed protein product [Closterium sp. Yama58-4]|nr:unnamed protein product [Closterium sp. Yama58-4]
MDKAGGNSQHAAMQGVTLSGPREALSGLLRHAQKLAERKPACGTEGPAGQQQQQQQQPIRWLQTQLQSVQHHLNQIQQNSHRIEGGEAHADGSDRRADEERQNVPSKLRQAAGGWLRDRQRDVARLVEGFPEEAGRLLGRVTGGIDPIGDSCNNVADASLLPFRHNFASITASFAGRFGDAAAVDSADQRLASLQSPSASDLASTGGSASALGAEGHGFESPARHIFDIAMSADQVAKRLDGVPVYTVTNTASEFVLISDMGGNKSLGLFCFRREDAEMLLAQVKDREPSLGRGAKVVPVSLDKVYQLSAEGIAFRFLPDPTQVKHALQVLSASGETARAFDGVPVFQSENLILRSKNRRFCPVFFNKEDLDAALKKAIKQKQAVNPNMRVTNNIQVGSFEEVLKMLERNDEDSLWGDLLFIPPGMDAEGLLGKSVAASPPQPPVLC